MTDLNRGPDTVPAAFDAEAERRALYYAERRAERHAEARARELMRDRFRALISVGMLSAFAVGTVIGFSNGITSAPVQAPAVAAGVPDFPVPEAGADPSGIVSVSTVDVGKILPDVPWAAETQVDIFNATGRDPLLFAAVMAIANVETGFDAAAIGDRGRSLGAYQIQPRWHSETLAAYGWDSAALMDPVKGAIIAADILGELQQRYSAGALDSHALYMAWNAGPSGARKAIKAGAVSSAYSRKVVPLVKRYFAAAATVDVPPAN